MSTGKGQNLIRIRAADLYCGGGGFSRGLLDALEAVGATDTNVDLLAVNHWNVAIATHSLNHPGVRHLCESIEGINPQVAVPFGKLDLLIGSPECIHFSTARGGKPMNDQSRASAWCILRWLEALDVANVILENVPEFTSWGPLHPCTCGAIEAAEKAGQDPAKVKHLTSFPCLRPIQKLKGKFFRLFVRNLQALDYRVEWRTLVAADYGDATTRERLFLIARKGKKKIVWPEPTHAKQPEKPLQPRFEEMQRSVAPWRPAREIIDWDISGVSIYADAEEARLRRVKRPLAPNTLRRIFAGLQRFSGLPFILPHQHGSSSAGNVRSVGEPFPTITGTSADMFLCEPWLVILRNHGDFASLDDPLRAICAGGGHLGLAEPCIIGAGGPLGAGHPRSVNEPLGTILGENHRALVDPCVIGITHQSRGSSFVRGLDQPLHTVTGQAELALMEPLLAAVNHGPEARFASLDDPLRTITQKGTWGLVQPQVLGQQSGAVARPVSEPLPTVAGTGAISLAEFLVNMKGQSNAADVDQPAPAITAHARHLGVAESYLTAFHNGRDGSQRNRSLGLPLPTVDTSNRFGLCDPFVVKYYGTGGAHSVNEPVPTITTRDRLALVHPEVVRSGEYDGQIIGWLDILFRMLQPHELAGAMSFPKRYFFTGTKEDQVRQIGNAVPVRTAKALCAAVLASTAGSRAASVGGRAA